MRTISAGILLGVLFSFEAAPASDRESLVVRAAQKIDELVLEKLQEKEIEPHPPTNDDQFLRRIYLDVAGRIPTRDEIHAFQQSTAPDRRKELIQELLASDAHTSHAFNYWADILRINAGLGNNAQAAANAYQLWLKNALKRNLPYDEMVKELITAQGLVWDNGAIGYYVRDSGMPLDNMANTVRIFLGTRIECAQCHDHPFDVWTQKDFYHMAAFSYGMDTSKYERSSRKKLYQAFAGERKNYLKEAVGDKRVPRIPNEAALNEVIARDSFKGTLRRLGLTEEEFVSLSKKTIAARSKPLASNGAVRDALRAIYRPLRLINTTETANALKLPHDYQYDNGAPFDEVAPQTMFGNMVELTNPDDSLIESYADWMVSRENPTFNRVIANRLWKRAFGHGIFEPVDELTDTTPISNPALLDFLEKLMAYFDYDMRAFQEAIYRSEAYQRQVHTAELKPGAPYYFPGPVLRRMSAEQVWDSIVTLTVGGMDDFHPNEASQIARVEKLEELYHSIENLNDEDFRNMAGEVGEMFASYSKKEQQLKSKATDASPPNGVNGVKALRAQTTRQIRNVIVNYGKDETEAIAMEEEEMSMNPVRKRFAASSAFTKANPAPTPRDAPPELKRGERFEWAKGAREEWREFAMLVSQLARASELASPAPRGHFLREFGQSDRDVIENASYSASIPQALNLLNGPMFDAMTNPHSLMGKAVDAETSPEQKFRIIFQAMLTRHPSPQELQLAMSQFNEKGEAAYDDVAWALLNTQQFLFVQ